MFFKKEKNDAVREELNGLRKTVDEMRTAIRKQEMSLEDLTEVMEERDRNAEAFTNQIKQFQKKESNLLALVQGYAEQYFYIRKLLKNDPSWSEQLNIVEQKMTPLLELAGVSVFGESGQVVDYRIHDVIQAVKTDEPERDQTVEQICSCGMAYHGEIIKKAQVTAFLYEK